MPRRALGSGLLVLALVGASGAARAADDPWQLLGDLRVGLAAAGTLAGDFDQTFVPAGFSDGEQESGRLALAIPDCLRWDYLVPYRKSYLLCGSQLYYWVEGDPQGQRSTLEASTQRGLDLLLLPAEALARRYRASARPEGANRLIELEPLGGDATLARVELTIDPVRQRPVALAWTDREGNATRFRFSALEAAEPADRFSPPADLEWKEP